MSLSKKKSAYDTIHDTNLSSLKETSEIDGSMQIFTPEMCLPKLITRLGAVHVQEVKWQKHKSGNERNHYTYTVRFKPGSSTTLTNRSDSLTYQGDTCSERGCRCYQDDSRSKSLVRDFEGMSKSVEQGNRSSAPTEKAHFLTSTNNLSQVSQSYFMSPNLSTSQISSSQSLSVLSPCRTHQSSSIKPVCITPISCISQKAVHLILMEKGLKGIGLVTIEETDWFWANTKLKEAITTFAQEHERLKSITEYSNVFFNANLLSHVSNNWMKADAGSMNSTLNELAGSSEILRVMINAFE